MVNKFKNKDHMIIVENYDTAMQILKHPSFIVPDLVDFIDRLTDASGCDFPMLRLFVHSSPFFLEGERHEHLKKVGSDFLGPENYQKWQPFFQKEIDALIDNLHDSDEFDLVEEIGIPVFTKLLRPFLGVHPVKTEAFDKKAIVLQRLVEPMLSISKLRQVNTDLTELMNNLHLNIPDEGTKVSMLNRLLAGDFGLSLDEKKAYVIVLYAAVAPLAQTIINILVNVYEGHDEVTAELFRENVDYYIWKSAAPIYIHRMALHDTVINDLSIQAGNTVLIEISSSFIALENRDKAHQVSTEFKNFAFGQGKHFCMGAFLSKSLILELIPKFLNAYPRLQIQLKKADDTNHIARAFKSVRVKKENSKIN